MSLYICMMVEVDRLVPLFLTKLRLVCDYRIMLSAFGVGHLTLSQERARRVCETCNAEKSSGNSAPTTERRNVWTWQEAIMDRMFLGTSLCSSFMRCRYPLDYSDTVGALFACLYTIHRRCGSDFIPQRGTAVAPGIRLLRLISQEVAQFSARIARPSFGHGP
jgi:hypothetical protein